MEHVCNVKRAKNKRAVFLFIMWRDDPPCCSSPLAYNAFSLLLDALTDAPTHLKTREYPFDTSHQPNTCEISSHLTLLSNRISAEYYCSWCLRSATTSHELLLSSPGWPFTTWRSVLGLVSCLEQRWHSCRVQQGVKFDSNWHFLSLIWTAWACWDTGWFSMRRYVITVVV